MQLCFDCWNLLDAPGGTSRRSVYLSPGLKEPDPSYRNRIENARPTGFFRDALRTYAGMLSFLEYLALPPSLQWVISDVDGRVFAENHVDRSVTGSLAVGERSY